MMMLLSLFVLCHSDMRGSREANHGEDAENNGDTKQDLNHCNSRWSVL
jgi:hypothetical protein|nr:MAG TPA: hypothetical protein [Caudoviricetes sp.]